MIGVSLDMKLDGIYDSTHSKTGKGSSEKKRKNAWDGPPWREAAMFNKAMHVTSARCRQFWHTPLA